MSHAAYKFAPICWLWGTNKVLIRSNGPCSQHCPNFSTRPFATASWVDGCISGSLASFPATRSLTSHTTPKRFAVPYRYYYLFRGVQIIGYPTWAQHLCWESVFNVHQKAFRYGCETYVWCSVDMPGFWGF